MTKPTEISQFIADCDGGVFDGQVSQILSEAAMSTVTHGKQSKVVIEFNMKRIGESQQVMIDNKLNYKMPTAKGSVSEDSTTNTPFYVGQGGRMSLFPENQTDMFTTDKKQSA